METKHTPGTWEVDGEFVGPAGQRDVGICHVLPMEDEYGHGWARGPITKANSHLIAAAPDMLAALYEVEIYLSERSDVIDGDRGIYFEWIEVVYGDDDSAASIVDSAWGTPSPGAAGGGR